jgi:hypothetical protein
MCGKQFNRQFIRILEAAKEDCWFQKDGATAHFTNSKMEIF